MRTRRAIADAAGHVEVLSYDRAPDGLFGDDIKTRCSVLFLDKTQPAELRVGPMIRLTSANRAERLRRGGSAPVTRTQFTGSFVPKLSTDGESALLRAVLTTSASVSQLALRITTSPLLAVSGSERDSVLLAPTAYNWLNVQRDTERSTQFGHDSQHPFIVLQASAKDVADTVYAALSSRVALWLWRVYGDGFHVSQRLLKLIPAPGSQEDLPQLGKLGSELWRISSRTPVISQNGGRTTVAFPPGADADDLLDEIDALMLGLVGLSDPPVNLRGWSQSVAAAGRQGKGTH